MKPSYILFSFLLVSLSFTAGGCGDGRPKRVPVSGQILIDGKPVKAGLVRFIPADHRASQGTLDQEGRFTLSCFDKNDGAVVGEHKLEIMAYEFVNPELMRWYAPKKYQDQQTSGVTQTVTGPTDNMVINLTWDGGKVFDEVHQTRESLDRKEFGEAFKGTK
jgi:hypothetical protein